MDTGLTGKRALVLGSSKGLGFAIAQALRAEGARVGLTARSESDAVAAAQGLGDGAFGFACDTRKSQDVDDLYEAAMGKLGGIDIVVLNTGGPKQSTARAVSSEQWRESFDALFVNLVRLANLTLDGMIARKFGRIISVSSSVVIEPVPSLAISNSIRPALIGWGKTLAREVASEGVTVNAIAPGRMATDRASELDAANARRTGRSAEEIRDSSLVRIPAGRFGLPNEFAAAAVFLASDAASYITGSVMRVDGGLVSAR